MGAFELRVAELIAARLCHEMVSPIGAISNGLELLEDDTEYAKEATVLIGDSVRIAARRLQFYRIAYGSVGPVTDEAARRATADLLTDGKVGCDWPETAVLPTGWQKLMCNVMLLATEALPRGGRLTLSVGRGVAITAEGDGARLPPRPAEGEELTPRTVQGAFTAALAYRLGLRFEVRQGGVGEVVFTLSP